MNKLVPRPRVTYVIALAVSAGLLSLSGQPLAPPSDVPQQATPTPNSNSAAAATSTDAITPAQEPAEIVPPGGNRVLGVLPNYRTADRSQENTTISGPHKLLIATKDSFDYPLVGIGGIFAGLGQLTDQNPSFGQGVAGFARRWGTAYADQAMGNMFTEGIFPALLREDPRYFRRGSGSTGSRIGYALSRIVITKTDAGSHRFNFSEWMGNASSVAISNLYYPDSRTWNENATKLLEQCGTDAVSQVLKEFWPDIRRKLFHKKEDSH